MFAGKRPRSRNGSWGSSDLERVVRNLAAKFSGFPDFTEALCTPTWWWQSTRRPKPEDIGGSICRGQVVEEVHRRSTHVPCLTVDRQKGPPGGLLLRGRARIPCPEILGHGSRTRPNNTIPVGGPFATWSRATARPGYRVERRWTSATTIVSGAV